VSYLLIDAGNSFLKIALVESLDVEKFTGKTLSDSNFIYHVIDYNSLSDHLFELFSDEELQQVIICNVGNPVNFNVISDVLYNHWRITPILIEVEQDKFDLSTRYTNPRVLGSDRWVAMIAARREFNRKFCVVDCGTAVTVDVVSDSGMHLGGLITPGIKTAQRSLGVSANNLPVVDNNNKNINNDVSFLATNTRDAILGGTLYQLSAYIERIVSEIKLELGDDIECIITGGDADKIQGLTYHHFHYRETLVLDGLRIIAQELFQKVQT